MSNACLTFNLAGPTVAFGKRINPPAGLEKNIPKARIQKPIRQLRSRLPLRNGIKKRKRDKATTREKI